MCVCFYESLISIQCNGDTRTNVFICKVLTAPPVSKHIHVLLFFFNLFFEYTQKAPSFFIYSHSTCIFPSAQTHLHTHSCFFFFFLKCEKVSAPRKPHCRCWKSRRSRWIDLSLAQCFSSRRDLTDGVSVSNFALCLLAVKHAHSVSQWVFFTCFPQGLHFFLLCERIWEKCLLPFV